MAGSKGVRMAGYVVGSTQVMEKSSALVTVGCEMPAPSIIARRTGG